VLKLKLKPRVEQWLGAGCLLLVSAVFALMAVDQQVELDAARELADSGIQTRATVTRMSIGSKGRTYITYRFQVGERQFWGIARSIPSEKYAELQEGVEIPVRFDPANPHRHITLQELAKLERWSYRVGVSLLSLGFLTGCVLRLRDPRWKKSASKPNPRRNAGKS